MNSLKQILGVAVDSLQDSFNLVWSKIAPILPDLAIALVVLALGLTVASFVSDQIAKLVKKIKIGDLLDKIIFAPIAKLTGVKINATSVIAVSVKWFLLAIVLIAALDLAHMAPVVDFVNNAIAFLPNIFAAALVIIAGALVANLAAILVSAVSKKDALANIAKIAVNALALIVAIGYLATPVVGSASGVLAGLNLSKLQADALFIGVLILILLASKSAVSKIIDNLHKT